MRDWIMLLRQPVLPTSLPKLPSNPKLTVLLKLTGLLEVHTEFQKSSSQTAPQQALLLSQPMVMLLKMTSYPNPCI